MGDNWETFPNALWMTDTAWDGTTTRLLKPAADRIGSGPSRPRFNPCFSLDRGQSGDVVQRGHQRQRAKEPSCDDRSIPQEITRHAVRLFCLFTLSRRDVGDMLA